MKDTKIGGAVVALFLCQFIFANQALAAAQADIVTTRTNVLNYITNLKNQPSNKVMSGQHAGDSLPITNPFSAQSGYASYITALQTSSGKLVAIAGGGYDALSPTIRPLSDLLNVNTVLKAHWNAGGLVEIGFATHNPWTGGQCNTTNTSGLTLTDVATPGTAANTAFVKQLDDYATALADLETAGVVVLARPFHEFNGNWFWWGAAANGQDYINLWRYMHDYLTNTKGLKNLIWVWAGSGGATNPLAQYYPGSAYVDIVGIDLYSDTLTANAIAEYTALAAYGKPFALAEYGPNTNTTAKTGTLDWTTLAAQIKASMPNVCYFKAWSDYIAPAGVALPNEYWSLIGNKNAGQLLADPWVVTADELPNFTLGAQTGSLTVTISPAGAVSAGARWNVDGGAGQTSGATVSNLAVGSHTVSFSAVTGYTAPANQNVTITAGQTALATAAYTTGGAAAFTVTATGGSGGSVTPASWGVTSGSTASFTATASAGYTTSSTVGGTCLAGSWIGTVYTTGAVTAACSVSFYFTGSPTVASGGVGGISAVGGASLNGLINPGGLTTTVSFEYGTTTAYGTTITIAGVTGYTTQTISSGALTGLTCGTTYHYRVTATNAGGTNVGADATFVACVSKTFGDLDGDGVADILWRNTSTGANSIWLMNATTIVSQNALTTVPSPWTVAGIADFDGDGKADILWRNASTGANSIWLMNGATIISRNPFTAIPTAWAVVGVADFDGDGKADILWRNMSTGANSLWLMNGATIISRNPLTTVPAGWTVAGVGDLNGDGKADILWRNASTGANSLWLMNGFTKIGGGPITAVTGSALKVAGLADFNGDGKADILWRNTSTGANSIWLMNGTTIISRNPLTTVPAGWTAAEVADFNGDGMADILWRNTSTGANSIWLMNGFTKTGGGASLPLGIAWKVKH
jgi:beta-mannanase